jgi:hypothetical protein
VEKSRGEDVREPESKGLEMTGRMFNLYENNNVLQTRMKGQERERRRRKKRMRESKTQRARERVQ